MVTALYPSDNGKVAIKEILTSDSVDDTKIALVFEDGSVVMVDENDYPCYADGAETL